MFTLDPDQWKVVTPYLDEALALQETEQAVWLASLREQNPELAARVEILLAEHHNLASERFLDTPPVALTTDSSRAGLRSTCNGASEMTRLPMLTAPSPCCRKLPSQEAFQQTSAVLISLRVAPSKHRTKPKKLALPFAPQPKIWRKASARITPNLVLRANWPEDS